jgi:hypothetical protein
MRLLWRFFRKLLKKTLKKILADATLQLNAAELVIIGLELRKAAYEKASEMLVWQVAAP